MRTAVRLLLPLVLIGVTTVAAQETKTLPKAEGPNMVAVGDVVGLITKYEPKGTTVTVRTPLGPNGRPARNSQELVFELSPELKVRVNNPPVEKDDKGRPKRLSSAELKKLKGEGADAKLPGYTAEISQLQPKQIVSVKLVKPAGKKPIPGDIEKLTATVIVILAEAQAP